MQSIVDEPSFSLWPPASLHLQLRSTSSSEFEADPSALNNMLNKTRIQIQVKKLHFQAIHASRWQAMTAN